MDRVSDWLLRTRWCACPEAHGRCKPPRSAALRWRCRGAGSPTELGLLRAGLTWDQARQGPSQGARDPPGSDLREGRRRPARLLSSLLDVRTLSSFSCHDGSVRWGHGTTHPTHRITDALAGKEPSGRWPEPALEDDPVDRHRDDRGRRAPGRLPRPSTPRSPSQHSHRNFAIQRCLLVDRRTVDRRDCHTSGIVGTDHVVTICGNRWPGVPTPGTRHTRPLARRFPPGR